MSDVSGYRNRRVANRKRADDLLAQADECRALARRAIEEGSPVAAREWLEAAEQAYRASAAADPLPPRSEA